MDCGDYGFDFIALADFAGLDEDQVSKLFRERTVILAEIFDHVEISRELYYLFHEGIVSHALPFRLRHFIVLFEEQRQHLERILKFCPIVHVPERIPFVSLRKRRELFHDEVEETLDHLNV